jgi:hypothetical protein
MFTVTLYCSSDTLVGQMPRRQLPHTRSRPSTAWTAARRPGPAGHPVPRRTVGLMTTLWDGPGAASATGPERHSAQAGGGNKYVPTLHTVEPVVRTVAECLVLTYGVRDRGHYWPFPERVLARSAPCVETGRRSIGDPTARRLDSEERATHPGLKSAAPRPAGPAHKQAVSM